MAVPAQLLSTWFVCSWLPASRECAGLILARVWSEGLVTPSCGEGDRGVGVLCSVDFSGGRLGAAPTGRALRELALLRAVSCTCRCCSDSTQ